MKTNEVLTYVKYDGLKSFSAFDINRGTVVLRKIFATLIEDTEENRIKLQDLADRNKHINLQIQLRDLNGKVVFTTSTNTALGIPFTEFIWHGAYSDPEIRYKKIILNYYQVEDYFYSIYKEVCEEKGLKPSENGFNEWIKSQDKFWVVSCMDEIISTL